MPISTVYKVIKKKLRLHAYKVQTVQVLEPDERPRRMAFATDMLRRIDDDAEFLKRIMFSDEASLTPLDFLLWGFVKDNVYWRRVSNIGDLKARITTAIASVDADMLAGTCREIEYRLDILRATKGAHEGHDKGHETF
ncbi:hypothetical protein X975_01287, partial [Stegodyphus mimosarum]